MAEEKKVVSTSTKGKKAKNKIRRFNPAFSLSDKLQCKFRQQHQRLQ